MERLIHFTEHYFKNPPHPISVMLVGCGGTGSQVATGLAKINACLKNLNHPGISVCIVDPDQVEFTNIGRQTFSEQDIGDYKANVIVKRLNRFFDTRWNSYPVKFEDLEDSANIVIICVDNYQARKNIYETLKKINDKTHVGKCYYIVDAGNSNSSGQVWISTINDIEQPKGLEIKPVKKLYPWFKFFKPEEENESVPSCSTMEALLKQDLFVNQYAATITSDIVWKLIREDMISFNGIFFNYSNSNYKFVSIPIKK